MIEVILDLQEIKTQEQFILYMREKLGLPCKNDHGDWDTFRDDFGFLRFAEIEEYNPIKSKWKNKKEWEKYQAEDAQYGLKNEKGIRDDLLLTFLNFRGFYLTQREIAVLFLRDVFRLLKETDHKEGSDILDIQILIKS